MGNYIKINALYACLLFEGLSLLFSRLVIEQQSIANLFIWFKIKTLTKTHLQLFNFIYNCFAHLSLSGPHTQKVMLTLPVKMKSQLQNLLSLWYWAFSPCCCSWWSLQFLNRDPVTLPSFCLFLLSSESAIELRKSPSQEHPDYVDSTAGSGLQFCILWCLSATVMACLLSTT